MSDSTRYGLGTLGAAVLLGIVADSLLRATPLGLNVGIWTFLFVVAIVALATWRGIGLGGDGRWLLAVSVVVALLFAWRDSPTLKLVYGLSLLIGLGLAATTTRTGQVRIAGLTDYTLGLLIALVWAFEGLARVVFRDVGWRELSSSPWQRQALATGRGLLLALPLALIFGRLLAAADDVFNQLLLDFFRWDLGEILGHAFAIATWAWVVGGYLRNSLVERAPASPGNGNGRIFSLGVIETTIVLGTLNALFLAFVLVQFRYFFGGAAIVQATTTLTYAEYARRGFFELVTVAALALPLLLAADWARRREGARDEWLFRLLAAAMVAMLFIIMISAVQRMLLYQSEYGLTELRVYTTAFMGWLAILFGWFLATVLPGHRSRFAFGALVSGFAVVVALTLLNPDALIVATNASRPSFDVAYHTSLSADAVPTLINALPALSESDRRAVSDRILARWSPPDSPDWRSTNLARAIAWRAITTHEAQLRNWAERPR